MSNRLKWVNAMLRELIQGGRNFCRRSDNGGVECFPQHVRFIKYNDGEGKYQLNGSRRAEPAKGTNMTLRSGSTLKDAVAKLRDRVYHGVATNSYFYVDVLRGCCKQKDLELVEQVHDCAKKSQLEQHPFVASNLMECYIRCGRLQSARDIFNKLLRKDTVTWNIMIGGYAEHDQAEGAIETFKQMRSEGGQANAITYLNALKACASPTALRLGKELHAHIIRDGFRADVRIGTALVLMYAKCGSIEDAKEVFGTMTRRNIISWNVMIGGLAQHGLGQEAFSFFVQMQREGFVPDSYTYLNILNPSLSTGALDWVKEVHALATKAGLDVDSHVGTALVHMYAKIGIIADARQVFDKLLHRDVVSWTAMIGGLAQHGHGGEALQLFDEMKSQSVMLSGSLFVAVLLACNHAGLVDEGRFQFVSMSRDYGIEPVLEHYTCMVDIFGRAGHLQEAKLVILNMPMKPDLITWKTLLGACRTYNKLKLAELAAKECLELEPMDPSPYVLLSNIYAAVGSWDQVSLVRGMMQEKGIRKEPGWSWIEVENKVHQFAAGDKSHPEARDIYDMLNSLSEKMKAEGYNPETRLRSIVEDDNESALFVHSEKLAIAYGLMHVSPGKPIRLYKNLRICTDCHTATKLISKIVGREIVARDVNRFHHFKDGFCSCGDYW